MKTVLLFYLIISIQSFMISIKPQGQYEEARHQMVEQQIKARGINDAGILNAMKDVKRHLFVPERYQDNAYEDRPLPIGEGQTISQPYIVAYMTEVIDPGPSDRILEVGTGSGYQAAVLSKLCDSVYSIEIVPTLGQKAKQTLNHLNYNNVKVKIGDGYQGWQKYAPYDAIIVTCAPTDIPSALKEQLAEGGKMIIPVGEAFNQQLIILHKTEGELIKDNALPVRFVPMVDEEGDTY